MLLATAPGVERTTSHWRRRSGWRPGRRQLTFHLTFDDDPGFADATARLRSALASLPSVDVVPPRWLHLTLTALGFTDAVDEDAAAAAADEVIERTGHLAGGELAFDSVLVADDAVLLLGADEGRLGELVRVQRAIVERHLGTRTWHAFRPHVSLGYANAAAPVTRLVAALADAAGATPPVTGRPTLALLELACEDHRYHWRVLRQA